MSCKHDFMRTGTVSLCRRCFKTDREIDLEVKLEAAESALAESRLKLEVQTESLAEETKRREQAEASCAVMRLRFEKYVRENCKLIRHGVADGLGKPDDVEGKCGGYAQNGDEPHYICQECVAAYDPEDEYNENVIAAGSALLAELQRYREAASSSAPAGEDAP